jgi:hypothetical protein
MRDEVTIPGIEMRKDVTILPRVNMRDDVTIWYLGKR